MKFRKVRTFVWFNSDAKSLKMRRAVIENMANSLR
jgi:hypothetical protein